MLPIFNRKSFSAYAWFERFVNPSDSGEMNVRPLYRLFVFGFSFIFIMLSVDVYVTLKVPEAAWHGVFGDFFGGVVNPILTFLTFMGLLITIVMQRVELRETRRELERSASALGSQVHVAQRQSNENTFFKMLEAHGALVSSIDLVSDENVRVVGRDAIRAFYRRLRKELHNITRKGGFWLDGKLQSPYDKGDICALKTAFDTFWKANSDELQHYYGGIFVTLAFVDLKFCDDSPYVSMFRSSFSDSEKLLMFYYSLCVANSEFKRLVIKYNIVGDIPEGRLLNADHQRYSYDLVLSKAQYK
ncbi:putative phage abortive infection protein [Pseudomonas qingdaonensis]|uniref:putative phage abortive infection protein n=1 Tax=Pseudomonas qingdaonensis TaxID=2056231 RepID=UPI000E222FA4